MKVGRLYDDDDSDGTMRVLVDRLWPRGIKRDDPRIDLWAPDVAPSDALRKWYGHEPARYAEFKRKYADELATDDGRAALKALRARTKGHTVRLITASKDMDASHTPVLAKAFAKARA